MKQFSPEVKHSILLEYRPHSPTHGLAALAARHGVAGGKSVLHGWLQRWDGTPASLQHKPVRGRPRKLNTAQVTRHVRTRIVAANRRGEAIHYPDLLPVVQQATGSDLSPRTLRRYGHDQLGASQKRGRKRTAEERQCNMQRERGVELHCCV